MKPRLFANLDYAALWTGQFVSIFGDRLNSLALFGLISQETQEFRIAGSSFELSKLTIFILLPAILFGPFIGVLVDRWNTKRVLMSCDLIRAGLVILIPFARTLSDSLYPVYGVVFLLYTMNVFFLPARSAILPELVQKERLLQANSVASFGAISATILGSALGGFIVAKAGWRFALYLDSLSFMFSVAAISFIRYHPAKSPNLAANGIPSDRRQVRLLAELRRAALEIVEGWRTIRSNRSVRISILSFIFPMAGGAALLVGGTALVRKVSGEITQAMGFLLGALGCGAIFGSILMVRYGGKLTRSHIITGGFVILGISIFLFTFAGSFFQMTLIVFLMGAAISPIFITSETTIQQSVAEGIRGRVFGTRDFSMRTLFLISAVFVGLSVERIERKDILRFVGLVLWFLAAALFVYMKRKRVMQKL
ncbi:MAG: MFS transporter [Candidatus Eisenbacteria bacterium]|nr:MFS transporter [Candidatus Eisenbacteria bacterium]